MMNFAISCILLSCYIRLIFCQQPYIGQEITSCESRDNSTSVVGYACNGLRRTCQSYLTFRAQPPYNSLSSISALFSLNSSLLSQLNSLSESQILETDRMLLLPVTCSCSGNYYQVNTSYVVRNGDVYFTIANNTFQGLSTCQSLQVQNAAIPAESLFVGARLNVPLRCACPTKNQTDQGFNYLLTYLVTVDQSISSITDLFQADIETIFAANSLSSSVIYPYTTLLVPLKNPPTSSQVTGPQPQPPPPSAEAGPPPSGGSSKTWVYVVVGLISAVVGASICGAVIYLVFFRKQRKAAGNKTMGASSDKLMKKKDEENVNYEDFMESIEGIAQSLKVYTYGEIKSATENFSSRCLIRGSVYRGVINGDFAAIKIMNGDVSKEISLLNKINHFNVIRLSGVSFNRGNWYLVYEYASNGSLFDWIDGKSDELSWNMRIQIFLDVAAGLNYLHRYTTPPHVHRDLNARNVLLDGNFRAKIGKLGMGRSWEGEEGELVLTRHIVGTKGYMAPEYVENGIVSTKVDVYAFGILVVEMMKGVSEDVDPEVASLVLGMADKCVEKEASDRPSMDEVFQLLSSWVSSGEWGASNVSDSQHMSR